MKAMTLTSAQPRFRYTACPREFQFRGIGGGASAKDVSMSPAGIQIDPDLAEYLQARASESGMEFWDAYNEEMEARATATREALGHNELESLAKLSDSNPQVLDADEECPF